MNTASRDIRVALIGYGTAGAVFHAPLIATTPGLALAAVVTGDEARAEGARSRYPDTEILESVDALWTRAREFDAVVIASPTDTHAGLARAAIDAGLAVVVDKPLAASASEARALIDAAETADVKLTVFQNRRWDADYLTLVDLIADDRLGTIRRFESRFERWRPEAKPGWKRDSAPEAAGGILFDLGSHLIDQALCLFGPVAEVYAELVPRYTDDGVDDDSFVALTHANGVISHLWMNSVAPMLGPRFRVLGSRAGYEKYGLDPQEEALREGAWPDSSGWGNEMVASYGQIGTDQTGNAHDREIVESRSGDYPAFYKAFAAALTDQAVLPVDPRDALATLDVIEAARRSAAGEQRVVIESTRSQSADT